MTSKITFLHTADIHLGAPIRGFRNLSDAWAARFQEAIGHSFGRVIDAAIANDVDFVVLAGDAFDASQASYGDYLRFFEEAHRLHEAGIPLYLIPGNHDPYTAWQHDAYRLPPSAHLLGTDGPQFVLYERDGEALCLIGARGYRNQAWPAEEPMAHGITRADAVRALTPAHPEAPNAPFCIGVIHTTLKPDQSKAYSDLEALLVADVDLWACGHLHTRFVHPAPEHPKVVFPGCVQGRDLNEPGEHGCYLVTMEEAGDCTPRVSLEFIPTADIVFHTVRVDVGTCQTLADVAHHAQALLFHENAKASCDNMVVRIVFVGTTDLHEFLAKPTVLADLRKRINNAYPMFYCDAIVDTTHPMRNRAAMMRDGLFEAHVLRVADRQRSHPEEMVNYVQAEFVKRGIDVPSSLVRKIGDYNDEAETLALDLLAEEGAWA